MSILVTGTLALDHIATVSDGFEPGDLNGKLDKPTQHWGGCGMNLAYALARLGQRALPWIYFGDNCPPGYRAHMKAQGLNELAMHEQPDCHCAEAYIFTRRDGSQLTGFYPGATRFTKPAPNVLRAIKSCSHWIAGPEDDATLLARLPHIADATELYWMPGQYAEVTRNNVLKPMLARHPNLVVNETEWQTLCRALGETELQQTVKAVFITRGEAGVSYRLKAGDSWQHRATKPAAVTDPTGCGDSFCATLVGSVVQGKKAEDAVDLAQATAAKCLRTVGAQTY